MTSPQKENGFTATANEIMDALVRTRIPGEARQVLDFIIRKTYGYNKKEDCISLSQFELATKLHKNSICKALAKLRNMNLITQKVNEVANSYSFNKHYTTWKPLPKRVTLPKRGMTITQKVKKCYPKGDIQKTVTKDNTTKDKDLERIPGQDLDIIKERPPNIQLMEDFKTLYEQEAGLPFKWASKDFVISARLIKDFGYDMVINKCKLMAVLCRNASTWFTKGGWADFGIGKVSVHWNEIIPEQLVDKEEMEAQKRAKEAKEHNDRVNDAIKSYREGRG
jgi:phage replication O-like protein O